MTQSFASDLLSIKHGGGGGGGLFPQYQLARELEDAWKLAYRSYYKEAVKVAGLITSIGIYTDNTKTTQLFSKVASYAGNVLTQVVTTRISDGATLTKTITSSPTLVTKTAIAVP